MRARADRGLLAALLLWASATGAVAESLGTLFHTPEERARLDRMRRGEATEAMPAGTPQAGEVTGFVKRSDGRSTVWIDGIAVPARTAGASSLMDPAAVRAYADRKQDDLQVKRRPPPR